MDNPFNLNYDALDTKPVQLLSSAYNVVEGNMWVICNSDGAPVDDEGKEIVGTPDYDDTESDAETNMYNYSTEMQDELGLHVANLWDEEGNQPCMNYFYPLKELDASDAIKLEEAKLPLCIIEFESGDTGLTLTGGGMDLTWEICQAFIVLGYYPPAHFAKLPRMGGRGTSDADKATIAICRHALASMIQRSEWELEHFTRIWDDVAHLNTTRYTDRIRRAAGVVKEIEIRAEHHDAPTTIVRYTDGTNDTHVGRLCEDEVINLALGALRRIDGEIDLGHWVGVEK